MKVPRVFPWRWYFCAFLAITLFAITPLLGGIIAEGMVTLTGCNFHHNSTSACTFIGQDIRQVLYMIGIMTWMGIVTLTYGAVALALSLLCLGLHLLWRRISTN